MSLQYQITFSSLRQSRQDPGFEDFQEGSVDDKEVGKQKDGKGVWRIFNKGKAADSAKSASQTGVTPPPSYISNAASNQKVDEYDDDSGDITSTHVTGELGKRLEPDQPEVPQDLPKTAGFDFKAIGEVLGKNVDPETVKLAEPKVHAPIPTLISRLPPPLERSESAPPLSEDREQRSMTPVPSSLRLSAESEQPSPPLPATSGQTELTPDARVDVPFKPAKQFPSHVLKSAASIFSANPFATTTSSPVMQDTDVWESDRNSSAVPEHEDEGDIGSQDRYGSTTTRELNVNVGGFGEEETLSSDWGVEQSKPKDGKDDWALNNPW